MVTDLLLRVALAGLLGGLIGLERQLRERCWIKNACSCRDW